MPAKLVWKCTERSKWLSRPLALYFCRFVYHMLKCSFQIALQHGPVTLCCCFLLLLPPVQQPTYNTNLYGSKCVALCSFLLSSREFKTCCGRNYSDIICCSIIFLMTVDFLFSIHQQIHTCYTH